MDLDNENYLISYSSSIGHQMYLHLKTKTLENINNRKKTTTMEIMTAQMKSSNSAMVLNHIHCCCFFLLLIVVETFDFVLHTCLVRFSMFNYYQTYHSTYSAISFSHRFLLNSVLLHCLYIFFFEQISFAKLIKTNVIKFRGSFMISLKRSC